MKAIEFKEVNVREVNVRIAEHQPEYETLPARFKEFIGANGSFVEETMCFELDEEERKQVAETGRIWQTILQPVNSAFRPIKMSFLKPDDCTDPSITRVFWANEDKQSWSDKPLEKDTQII